MEDTETKDLGTEDLLADITTSTTILITIHQTITTEIHLMIVLIVKLTTTLI